MICCAIGPRRLSRSTSTTPACQRASRRSTTCCCAASRGRSRASCASTLGRKRQLEHDDDDDDDDDDDGGGIGGNRPPYRITDEDDDDADEQPDVCENPIIATLTVCPDLCRRIYEACTDCKAVDRAGSVGSVFATSAEFCRALAPKGFRIEVGKEPNCFGTSTDASLSGSFAQVHNAGRARVGTEVTVIIQAADDSGNYVLEGGSAFTARLEGPGDDPRFTLADEGTGRYLLRFSPTVSGTYDLHVFLDGKELVQSPFKVVVRPGEFDPSKTTLSGPARRCVPARRRRFSPPPKTRSATACWWATTA